MNTNFSKTHTPTDHPKNGFDYIVIIPVYDEVFEDVIRVIYSVATQKHRLTDTKYQAIVLNINNSTFDQKEKSDAFKQNLKIYNSIRQLKESNTNDSDNFQEPLSDDAKQMITAIREKLDNQTLHIELIDSFSAENTQLNNTIGFAREYATRYAVENLMKDENTLLFSTDADSLFGEETMTTAAEIFLNHNIDLTPLNLDYHFNNLDNRSSQSAIKYKLARQLIQNLLTLRTTFGTESSKKITRSALLEKAFNIGGAFTVIRASAFKRSDGYPDKSHKEDLYIAASIVKGGGLVANLSTDYPKAVVYTSPRVSHRVPSGYGTKIANFSQNQTSFFQQKVTSVDAHLDIHICIKKIEDSLYTKSTLTKELLLKIVDDSCPWLQGDTKKSLIKDFYDIFSNHPFDLFSDIHWDLSNRTKRLLRNKTIPQQTIHDQIQLLESMYNEIDSRLLEDTSDNRAFLDYASFKKRLLEQTKLVERLEIDLVRPIVICFIANAYLLFFIPQIKKSADLYVQNTALLKCELRLLHTLKYGHKGDLNIKSENFINNRSKEIRNIIDES